MGPPHSSAVQMAAVHSISKGFLGECGFRGGFMEVLNVGPEVLTELNKMAAVRLCPPVMGQVLLSAALSAPQPGEPSYDTYMQERGAVLQSLEARAELLWRELNRISGIDCQPIRGAMYGFPRMRIPERAVKAAQERGLEADEFFCWRLLERTGICVVPGSGFGQRRGSFHFRMTILPPMEALQRMVATISQFYTAFVHEFS
ncbi:alanine aminotransferase 1-like [Gallus gallus]|uniref:alanine aminotransferase 1-like n=1 Tax=Gallus gallus TaxID=9031 RepID=UPI001AE2CA88|nr:alanine aminotransferase 1-like [Gallus gallus]